MRRFSPLVAAAAAAAAFALGAISSAGAATPKVTYCENDKCMFMAWCQDGGLHTSCDMSNPIIGGCITVGCSIE